jgi:hypothetical protein
MRLALPAFCPVLLVSAAFAGGSAFAGPALDDDKSKERPAPTTELEPVVGTPESPIEYGVGIRARSVWVPRAILELFVDRAAGGAHNYGFGAELTRRRGSSELQLGFEYEHVNVGQGVWINKGENVAAGDEADYVLSPKSSGNQLSWFTAEFTFLTHAEINRVLAIRYGVGIGVGIIIGELDHYNIRCNGATNSAPEPGCVPPRFNGDGTYTEGAETQVAYDLPPVFPVLNMILGLELRPTEKMTISLEGGIRTLPFVGLSSSYFF